MTRLLFVIAAVGLLVAPVHADAANYGWEDCGLVLSLYGAGEPPIIVTNVMDPVHSGLRSLKLEDNASSGTPQAYIAWIVGLTDGDSVTASVWRHDTTPGASPSVRIWGHWNDDPSDVNGYHGSASGNDDYGPGTGWDQTAFTWTVADGHTGLVIEARTYSIAGDTVWIDDLHVEFPPTATLYIPVAGASATEPVSWTDVKALYR